ncbi:MAG: methyl-accepting chemotaxis protein [Deltaproteobacteria bacterium]|jgi:methyl-accepting chemotaxis protein|nr:methyl-accepting chemotaxis protein [Deltaproteobacteria bacterium]
MTTKIKIIFGFALMVVLLGAVGIMGYRGFQNSSSYFNEYRRLARLNVFGSDIIAETNAAALEVYRFLDNIKDTTSIDGAHKSLAHLMQITADSREFIVLPERNQYMDAMKADAQKLDIMVGEIQQAVVEADGQYYNTVQPSTYAMMDAMTKLAEQTHGANNINSLLIIAKAWDNLASVRASMSRYVNSRSEEDAGRSQENAAGLTTELQTIGGQLHTDEGRALYRLLMESNDDLNKALEKMIALNSAANQRLANMRTIVSSMRERSVSVNNQIDSQMLQYGIDTMANNKASETILLVISLGGFILGILMATFIAIGIVRVLNKLARFAGAIARGDFTHQLDVREKGEIGIMVGAMLEIPQVLKEFTIEANRLANHILSGLLRERIDTKEYVGSYADIAKAVNTVSDAYTGVMDELPVPVFSFDKQDKLIFANSTAKSVFGTDTGSEANAAIRTYGRKAMDTKSGQGGEVTLQAQGGKRMDAALTAIPMLDIKKEVAGYLESLNDLTAIKQQQNTMMQVAKEASDISDRVAAAAEELSAQVEQISRGAEVQRERIETTASAMTEMNSTVLEVARNAGQASEQSDNTRQKAESGAGLVEKVVVSMQDVNTVTQTMHTNMQELGEQAESIGGVMNVISDIADQTNLLALNAAIEAARAGEAGRGFAVVADEVRKLAEKTMSATKEVGDNITAIQDSTRKNIAEMENAAQGVSDATGLATESGAALTEIVGLAAANSSVVASIATAAEEQSATSEEINRAIAEVSTVIGETTEGMVQSSAAVQELSRMAQELRRVMERLR